MSLAVEIEPQQLQWQTLNQEERRLALAHYAEYPLMSDFDFIDLVRNGHELYASTGPNFQYAVFGRDSLEVAEDLLDTHEGLARTVILELAAKQGTVLNPKTEEEPGKILHEHRAATFNGQAVPDTSLKKMRELQTKWGEEGKETMTYYGSFDATPLFVRLIGRYAELYGPDILSQTVVGKDGEQRTIAECGRAATGWLIDKLDRSPSGLLEYRRLNETNGLLNQTWKDSINSYLFSDGTMANWDGGIASVELQGYAYDALMSAAKHLADTAEEIQALRGYANEVQQATLDKLWMEDAQFFAQGLDHDAMGNERQIDTLTSNAGLLLESRLLKDLPKDVADKYIQPLVATLCSEEFVTSYGMRCRALQHSDIPNSVGYHSSFAVWPKETFDVAKGLINHGFNEAGELLLSTITRATTEQAEFSELFYVDSSGTLRTPAQLIKQLGRDLQGAEELPVPEPGQAWTISSFIASAHKIHDRQAPPQFNSIFEHNITSKINSLVAA